MKEQVAEIIHRSRGKVRPWEKLQPSVKRERLIYAQEVIDLFKAEYPIMYKEEADEVGDFIRRGWIPTEHFKVMLDKLTVIEDEEWDRMFGRSMRMARNGGRLQLQHTKKELLDLMGE